MNSLREVAPAFVEMAHRIVWCCVFPGTMLLEGRGEVLTWQD